MNDWMLSAFKYRLYPKPGQETRLNRSLLALCNLHNDLKTEEMRRYREEHKSTSKTMFRALALDARKHDEQLQDIHSQVVQNAGDRIHRSFRNFFEGRARFPKWKKPHRYNSLTYPQSGFRLNPEKGLLPFGLGYIRIFVHPWGTTQFCHSCLEWVPKDLAERRHKCPNCGIEILRDVNSALLIKRLGILRSPAPDRGSSRRAGAYALPQGMGKPKC